MRRIITLFALSFALGAAPTIQTVCASGCTTTNFQTAINTAAAANSGPQIIELKAGENFDTATGFALPARTGSYTGWIVIRSSRAGELPATTRVAPADTAKMAAVRVSTGNYTPVIYTSGHPSAYWRLEGLEITLTTTGLASSGWLVGIGQGTDSAETEAGKVSHHIVIDRCYVHGIAFDNGPRDGIRVNGDNLEILNSYISEIKRDDNESHGISAYSLNGPMLVRNTFHGGSAIGTLIGGAAVAGAGIHPQQLTFIGNHYQKTPTHRALRYNGAPQGAGDPPVASPVEAQTYWKTGANEFYVYTTSGGAGWRLAITGVTGNVCIDGDFWEDTVGPTYYLCSSGTWGTTGSNRTITGGTYGTFANFWTKNMFELKAVDGALVEGNRMEDCFFPTADGQSCAAILLMHAVGQNGYPTSVRDVTVRNNRAEKVAAFLQQAGDYYAEVSHRYPANVLIENNLYGSSYVPANMAKAGIVKMGWYWSGYISTAFGQFLQVRFGNQVVRHNTAVSPNLSTYIRSADNIYSEWAAQPNVRIDDNLIEAGTGYGNIRHTPLGYGCGAYATWSGSRFLNNVFVNSASVNVEQAITDLYRSYGCETWAWPYKRSGTGIGAAVGSALISGGYLKITFSTDHHGQRQRTKLKLAGWTPAGLNATYTVPDNWQDTGTATYSMWQSSMWLPTAEVGAVTPGTIESTPGFTDYAAGNFRLAASSPYKNWATDGADPGADQSIVEWATAGAVDGTYNPYLDFRVRSITATADGAVIRFTAYSTAACTWTISSTHAFADSLGSVSQSRTGRDGSATLSGLSSSTTYWYKATCDATYRDGEFTTGK